MKLLSLALLWIPLVGIALLPAPGAAATELAEPAQSGKTHRIWSYPSVVFTDPVWTLVSFPLVPSDRVAPLTPAP